jgi:hypothetical protein
VSILDPKQDAAALQPVVDEAIQKAQTATDAELKQLAKMFAAALRGAADGLDKSFGE